METLEAIRGFFVLPGDEPEVPAWPAGNPEAIFFESDIRKIQSKFCQQL
jgi:hypothetical protein